MSELKKGRYKAGDTDPLVEMLRKEVFLRELEEKADKAVKTGEPLSLIFMDVDNFGVFNKTYGQSIGDEVLRAVAKRIRVATTAKGTCYRDGGEEFCVLAENYSAREAAALAERIRLDVEQERITEKNLTVTLSIGVAEIPAHASDGRVLRDMADAAMRSAKNLGKNVVRISGESEVVSEEPKTSRRKMPDGSKLSMEAKKALRVDYFKIGRAYCPNDDVMLDIRRFDIDENPIPILRISCPSCGLQETLT